MLSNRYILQKADATLSELVDGGGALTPAQARSFLRKVAKKSSLLSQVTVPPMKGPKLPIPKIGISGRVLRAGQPGVALTEAERSKPEFSSVELDAKLFRGEVRLPEEIFEDNLEGPRLRSTLLELITDAVSRDIEEVVLLGDTADADPFLAQLDGLLKQASAHVVDAAGAPLDAAILGDTLRALPAPYRRRKKEMRFFTSPDAEDSYRASLSERATSAGDRFLFEDVPVMFRGVPVSPVELFPEDYGAPNQTALLFCHPKNIHVGFARRVKLRWGEDISDGTVKVVVTLRVDARFADHEGAVKVLNLAA